MKNLSPIDHDRILKRPKYRIGDIIVYRERYADDGMEKIHQAKIVEAIAYIEIGVQDDVLDWYYHTQETLDGNDDNLSESEILYSL